MSWLMLALACAADGEDTGTAPEPLVLPDDPAENGVPVGVSTVRLDGLILEVWYPAPDAVAGEPTALADITEFVPDSVTALLGEVELPLQEMGAVRDAPVRLPEDAYPVVFFSHGTAAYRLQSLDYAAHLASRGYVVVAPDHPGRMVTDFLPCLFSPPLEGCNLAGMATDPAPENFEQALAWLDEEGAARFHADTARIGMSGHSAGARSTGTIGNESERYTALLPMAYGSGITVGTPTLYMDGTCDGIVPSDSVAEAAAEAPEAVTVDILGAGHLAFSDICPLGLADWARENLATRDDVNQAFLEQLLVLATDGCPGETPSVDSEDCAGAYLGLDVSHPIIRHYSTLFFDQALSGRGDGPQGGVFPEAVLSD